MWSRELAMWSPDFSPGGQRTAIGAMTDHKGHHA
jgi:hypothetical protein